MNRCLNSIILILSFFTLLSCKKDKATQETVKDYDGNIYHTIKLGNQVWMVENLKTTHYNDGTPIDEEQDNTKWTTLNKGAYCWNNNDKNANEKYGALYNWYAIDARDVNNKPKLAPSGWHVATKADWDNLRVYLTQNGYNFTQDLKEGDVAKSMASTSGWTTYATPGAVGNDQISNNKSGFNALPGGVRIDTDGSFKPVGSFAYWWSSDLNPNDPTGGVYSYRLYYNFAYIDEYTFQKKRSGLSVRCIKD